MGDLSELIASITEKGIIEPLVVRQRGARYQIIAGERRYQAAVQAGLHELPVVVRDVDETEMLELALVENIQRKDLTRVRRSRGAAQPGAALRLHPRGPGQAPGQVAHVDHRVAVAARHAAGGPQGVPAGRTSPASRCCCRSSARATRRRCWRWSRRSPPRAARRASRSGRKRRSPRPAGPKAFTFNFKPPNKAFNLRLSFNKRNASKDEIIDALEGILRS